jgi:hypothetical protein
VGDVAVEDLVYYLQVALVPSLLQVTPEAGLVVFFGGHASSPPSLATSSLRGA